CPNCGLEITRQSVQQIVDSIFTLPKGKKLMILAAMIRGRKGEYQAVFEDLRKQGYSRVRVDGKVQGLDEEFKLDKNKKHTIEVVIDRLVLGEASEESEKTSEGKATAAAPLASELARVADSVETALKLGGGTIVVSIEGGEEILYSENFACVQCGFSLAEMAPRNFSFNSPHGACPECTGLGFKLDIDPDMVIPDKNLTLEEGAIKPWSRENGINSWYYNYLRSLASRHGFSMNMPVKNLSKEQVQLILHGENGGWDSFEGVIPNLERRFKQTESAYIRSDIERYMLFNPCPSCKGKRLKPEYLAVTVVKRNIMDVSSMSILEAAEWADSLSGAGAEQPPLSQREMLISNQVLKEIRSRLGFLRDVGLDYLSVDRASQTLSGGESQRIRLATQIGSGLMGVLYICDEPTVGLHPADDFRLIRTLQKLRDLGNTIIIVEHDEAMMRAADYIVDMGPGAGKDGGYVVAAGTLEEIMHNP
ncbi:MAG: excinuclease ABC subunit UvrA, partial [Dehalococcoidia bacterium]|nr:excinuclease ABC subunit UvrA [Dehalococcoidia bacterium]